MEETERRATLEDPGVPQVRMPAQAVENRQQAQGLFDRSLFQPEWNWSLGLDRARGRIRLLG